MAPMGKPCGYRIVFPPDDPFLGSTELVLDWPGNAAGPDPTALQKQTATWIAARLGLPFCHRSYVRWHVNGVTESQRGVIFESVLWPGTEFLEAWDAGEDEPGSLYDIEPRFERSNEAATLAAPPTLANCPTTSGPKNAACYRWNWRAIEAGGAHGLFGPLPPGGCGNRGKSRLVSGAHRCVGGCARMDARAGLRPMP